MANNYTQFSEALTLESPEEYDWLKTQLEEVCIYKTADRRLLALADAEPDPPEDSEQIAEYVPRFFAQVYSVEQLDNATMCPYQLRPAELWVYSEESDDPEPAILLVQQFLKKFHPDQTWAAGWAFTCDKPRTGEFGGGAAFVTADKIEWIGTYGWQAQQQARFAALKGQSHWEEHPNPDLSSDEWRTAVACDDTRLGYHDWIMHKLHDLEGESDGGEVDQDADEDAPGTADDNDLSSGRDAE